METQDAYRHRMKVQIEDLRAQANFLEAKLISFDLRIKRAERLNQSSATHHYAAEYVTVFRNSNAEAWNPAKEAPEKVRAVSRAA